MNKKLGIALAIMSILTMIATYSDILATPVIAVNIILGALISLLIMLKVYHYRGFGEENSGRFWFAYSAVCGVVMIAVIYATGTHLISNHLSLSLISGLFPTILPIIGIFFSNIGRILIKNEPSVI